jgi:hypothetical protein
VPYAATDPTRHPQNAQLLRLFFDIHIPTPIICSDANGDISVYVFPVVDGHGHLHILIDGWSFNYTGGEPLCRGTIDSKLNAALPGAMVGLQQQIDQKTALLDAIVVNRV